MSRRAVQLKRAEKAPKSVIANQSADWCGNPFPFFLFSGSFLLKSVLKSTDSHAFAAGFANRFVSE